MVARGRSRPVGWRRGRDAAISASIGSLLPHRRLMCECAWLTSSTSARGARQPGERPDQVDGPSNAIQRGQFHGRSDRARTPRCMFTVSRRPPHRATCQAARTEATHDRDARRGRQAQWPSRSAASVGPPRRARTVRTSRLSWRQPTVACFFIWSAPTSTASRMTARSPAPSSKRSLRWRSVDRSPGQDNAPRQFHDRDRDGCEVDIVLERRDGSPR